MAAMITSIDESLVHRPVDFKLITDVETHFFIEIGQILQGVHTNDIVGGATVYDCKAHMERRCARGLPNASRLKAMEMPNEATIGFSSLSILRKRHFALAIPFSLRGFLWAIRAI